MAVASTSSAAVIGVDAHPVVVEVDVSRGLPSFQIVGLPDGAVREARDRVRGAIRNSGLRFPGDRITVNLAPADLKKEGSSYDLPIAMGLLVVSGQIEAEALKGVLLAAELGLDGELRPVNGILPITVCGRDTGFHTIVVAPDNAQEAAVVGATTVLAPASLAAFVRHLSGSERLSPVERAETASDDRDGVPGIDFADVRGQDQAKRALEVAAAGGHNVLMSGPPGSGKTMLAMRLSTILPPMTVEESLEATKIYSVAGQLSARNWLVRARPFRSPHHSISDAGLIGGGAFPRPGEVSLSHNGVLFLDEFPEFRKQVLELLRQPLEDGRVTIARASMTITFPARCMLVASMNPCPCGYLGDAQHTCRCTSRQVERYQGSISGPLLDRIDINIEVPALPYKDLREGPQMEKSRDIQARVVAARQRQLTRTSQTGAHANAHLTPEQLRTYCALDAVGDKLMERVVDRMGVSARGHSRILKVARTIADLDGADRIEVQHLSEAIQYRVADRSAASI